MYGMMLSAKIVMRPSAPPANMSNMPRMPPACCWKICRNATGVDARQRDVGADPVDDQRAEREPDALLELGRLGEGAEIDIGGELFGGRCHIWHAPLMRSAASYGVAGPAHSKARAAGHGPRLGLRACVSSLLRGLGRLHDDRAAAFSTAAIADFEAPATSMVSLAFSSPLPSRRTPSRTRRRRPAATSAARRPSCRRPGAWPRSPAAGGRGSPRRSRGGRCC